MTDDRRRRAPLRRRPGVRELDAGRAAHAVLAAYEAYLETIPEAKRQQTISYAVKDVVGRVRVRHRLAPGCRAYNLLVEGRTPGAGERRRALDEAGADVAAVEPGRRDERIRELLRARGPPHGGLPARAAGARRPVAGLVRARRRRPGRSRSSRPTRPTWTGTTSPSPTRCCRCCATSAGRPRRSTASPTRTATTRWSTSNRGRDHRRDRRPRRRVRRRPGRRSAPSTARLAREDHRRFVDAFRNGMIRGVESD